MKGYGLPRNDDVANPDMGDIHTYGRASHIGKLRNKTGQYRSSFKKSRLKRAVRRVWKRLERIRAKRGIRKYYD